MKHITKKSKIKLCHTSLSKAVKPKNMIYKLTDISNSKFDDYENDESTQVNSNNIIKYYRWKVIDELQESEQKIHQLITQNIPIILEIN